MLLFTVSLIIRPVIINLLIKRTLELLLLSQLRLWNRYTGTGILAFGAAVLGIAATATLIITLRHSSITSKNYRQITLNLLGQRLLRICDYSQNHLS